LPPDLSTLSAANTVFPAICFETECRVAKCTKLRKNEMVENGLVLRNEKRTKDDKI